MFSPPHCVFCDKALDVRVRYCVCSECANKLPIVSEPKCRICGIKLPTAHGDFECLNCKKEKRHFAQNVSRYAYKDNVQGAIKRMKFTANQLWIADSLGLFLSETIQNEYGDINFDFVTYVPISDKRYHSRKFNQSRELANAACEKLKLKLCSEIIIKPLDTKKQSGLNRKQRAENVKGAFVVKKPEEVIDKTILLIDDVFTTGATLNECCKILKKAGALAIYTATVAIVCE